MLKTIVSTLFSIAFVSHCQAPELHLKKFCIDYRPALIHRVQVELSKAENCVSWNNPGCLRFGYQPNAVSTGPENYARFSTEEAGAMALKTWIEDNSKLSLFSMLMKYNGRPYAFRLIRRIKLDPKMVIDKEMVCSAVLE